MGWRTTTTRLPRSLRIRATLRVVWDFPDPVRTAHTATTGTRAGSWVARGDEPEVGPGRGGNRRPLHHVPVGDVGVGEHRPVHPALLHELGKPGLGLDGDPVGIEPAGELGRVAPALDPRDLGRRERHHLVLLPVPEQHVEVVEVAACGPRMTTLVLAIDSP